MVPAKADWSFKQWPMKSRMRLRVPQVVAQAAIAAVVVAPVAAGQAVVAVVAPVAAMTVTVVVVAATATTRSTPAALARSARRLPTEAAAPVVAPVTSRTSFSKVDAEATVTPLASSMTCA